MPKVRTIDEDAGPLARRYAKSVERFKEAERMHFREALERAHWLERPAAELLGIARSTFKRTLEDDHPELYKEAARQRQRQGYEGGNPPAAMRGE